MIIKVKGSHDQFRCFCQGVREFTQEIAEEKNPTDTFEDVENEVMDFVYEILFYSLDGGIDFPFNHVELTSEDEEEADDLEAAKQDITFLTHLIYTSLAERIVYWELSKIMKTIAA